jgi:hypothetical protein
MGLSSEYLLSFSRGPKCDVVSIPVRGFTLYKDSGANRFSVLGFIGSLVLKLAVKAWCLHLDMVGSMTST